MQVKHNITIMVTRGSANISKIVLVFVGWQAGDPVHWQLSDESMNSYVRLVLVPYPIALHVLLCGLVHASGSTLRS